MRTNGAVTDAVRGAEFRAVFRAVDETVSWDMGRDTVWAVDHVMDQALYRSGSAVVLWAVYNDPPHPALLDFLARAGAEPA